MRAQWCREHIDEAAKHCGLKKSTVSDVKQAAEFCADHSEISECSTDAIMPLIRIKDADVKARAISLVGNALNGETPTGGKKKNKLTKLEITKLVQKAELEVRGEITQKIKATRKPADPAPEEAPATMPAPAESRPVPAPQPVQPDPTTPAQPSLAAQMSGTIPPEPVTHNPPPCKGGGGCQRGKFVANDKTGRGPVCSAIGAPINQLPGNICPYDTKLERPAPVDSGFRQAGSGKPDLIVPGVPKVPTDPALVCLGLVAHVLPREDGEFVRRVAEKEFGGDLVLAVKGIIARVREA